MNTLMNPRATVICGIESLTLANTDDDLIILVDVFRLSSTITTAIANGFDIILSSNPESAQQLADDTGFALAGETDAAQYSLSPKDYIDPQYPETVILVSSDGAHWMNAIGNERGFIGCFLNARTVARLTETISTQEQRNIVLVAVGEPLEHQGHDFVKRRFAIEDYLACGMILSELHIGLTAEADICERTFEACHAEYIELIQYGLSGVSLLAQGDAFDVTHCVQKNIYAILPTISGEKIVMYQENLYR